jgi:glyoxylase-like metal-dependent hydrolase (beta-lactamase superfamily II)
MTTSTPIKKIHMFSTGSVQVRPDHAASTRKPKILWMLTSTKWTPPLPINVFVIEHRDGLVLFDTGQDRASVTDASHYFPGGFIGAMYRRSAKALIPADQTLVAGLGRLGYKPLDVSIVILSHLHQDHVGGLAALSHARFVVSRMEWDTLEESGAEMAGLMRRHIDLPGLGWNKITLEPTTDPDLRPFSTAYDVFNDGSMVLIPTPGHTPGSLSLIVRRPGEVAVALVGDLTFAPSLLESGHVPGAGDRKQLQQTTAMINELRRNLGGMVVLATHDPDAEGELSKAFPR